MGTPAAEAFIPWNGKMLRFSPKIAVYLGNGMRYYRSIIESHR